MELKNVPVTYWLLGILIVVFLGQLIADATLAPVIIQSPGGTFSISASDWEFALWPGRILSGQVVWGIFTNIFMHANFLHIFFNGFALYMFGLFLERRIGGKNILKIFIIAGIIGSLAHIPLSYLLGDYYIPALGASGAIFGILGALMVLAPEMRIITFPIPIPMKLWQGILMFLIFSILFIPSIASDVHIAGLIVGIVMGRYFRGKERSDSNYTWNAVYRPALGGTYRPKDNYEWIDEYR